MTDNDASVNYLRKLVTVICEDFHIELEQFYSRHARGHVATARHVYALVASDNGFEATEVEAQLRMHKSFVAQVLRRKYNLRQSAEYIHAAGVLRGWLATEQRNKVA